MDDVVLIVTSTAFHGWVNLLEGITQSHAGRENFHICLWHMSKEGESAAYESLSGLTGQFAEPVQANGSVFSLAPTDPHPGLFSEGWLRPGEHALCFKVTKKKRET